MTHRLLTDTEVKDVAHVLFEVSEDQEKRLKALHEDGHPEREASDRAISASMQLLALVETKTDRFVLRDKRTEKKDSCSCHRDLTHEEGILVNEAMDTFSDRIRHLFPPRITFAYLEQLARELVRVGVEDGVFYVGRPGPGNAQQVQVLFIDHEEKQPVN